MAKRVLCLGAFANGNLGDMYQADAVARFVKLVATDAEIVSVSPSKRRSAYPTKDHLAGPETGAFDPDYINGFDVLLVGGGGLLSAPHAPLNDAAWVERIKTRMCAVSVGAVADTAAQCGPFLNKCAAVSVRDEFSLASVRHIRTDAQVVMDPILLDAAAMPRREASKASGITWVPGKLIVGTEELWSDAIERLFKARDRLISFNPVTDRSSGFDMIFPDVEYLDSIEPFIKAALSTRLVLSERYHACIYALALGVPALGVCLRSRAVTSKIEELFRKLGCEDAIVRQPFMEKRNELAKRAAAINLAGVHDVLMKERARLIDYIDTCLN